MPNKEKLRKETVLSEAQGKWESILSSMVDTALLDHKHHPCPFCGGKDRFRFIDNEGDGYWLCNQCEPDGSDGIGFVMRLNNIGFPEALAAVAPLAGGARYCVKPKRSEKQVGNKIMKLWNGDRDNSVIDEYLLTRNISLVDIGYSHALRGALSVPFYKDGDRMGEFPAMLGLVTNRDGGVAAVHRTYIAHSKNGIRKMRKLTEANPTVNGCSIKLYDPQEGGVLGVGEGIETMLAVRQMWWNAKKELLPVWSAVSANGLGIMHIPENIGHVIVFGDNDKNYTGQKAAYVLANRLAARPPHHKVTVRIPDNTGTDWNDVLVHGG